MWNKDKIEELEGHMAAAGMREAKIQKERYHSPALYHGCVDWYVPHSRELFIRVRTVYAVFGHLKDSKTGRPFFNDATWKRMDNVQDISVNGTHARKPGDGISFRGPGYIYLL